jgi:hypothetical protein
MKTLKIGTKTQANKILLDSLFNPVNGKTLNRMKYCNGKRYVVNCTGNLNRKIGSTTKGTK